MDLLAQMGRHGLIPDQATDVYVDRGISVATDAELARLGLANLRVHWDTESHLVGGIQLADLVALHLGTVLEDALGTSHKVIQNPNGELGAHDELDLGFILWRELRYNFLTAPWPRVAQIQTNADKVAAFEGVGFRVSPHCPEELARVARKTFGTVYLGCTQ